MLDRLNQHREAAPRCAPVSFDSVSLDVNGVKLIDGVSCTLSPTGKTVLIGPNGAGKSMLLRLMSRLIKPTGGSVTGGVSPRENKPGKCQSFVFQAPVLLRRSALENVAFVLRQFRTPSHEIGDRAMAALTQVRLDSLAYSHAHQLSGGEKQRLALARALVVEPAILLMDEPTANLDPVSTSIVEALVSAYSDRGTKVVYVTHDIKQAKRLADEILFMHQGKALVLDEANAFFLEPGSEEDESLGMYVLDTKKNQVKTFLSKVTQLASGGHCRQGFG